MRKGLTLTLNLTLTLTLILPCGQHKCEKDPRLPEITRNHAQSLEITHNHRDATQTNTNASGHQPLPLISLLILNPPDLSQGRVWGLQSLWSPELPLWEEIVLT